MQQLPKRRTNYEPCKRRRLHGRKSKQPASCEYFPALPKRYTRLQVGTMGLRDPRSIIQGRNVLFGLSNGKAPLRRAVLNPCEQP
jgi:hypothetical protein